MFTFGLGFTSTDPIGALPEKPARRFKSIENARRARDKWMRDARKYQPGRWLAPHPVVMRLERGEWVVVPDNDQ